MFIEGAKVNEEFNFDEIDEKVKFINENKKNYEETIRELNTRIDVDYVKASEFIEGNTLEGFDKVDLDDKTKILRGYQPFIMDIVDGEAKFEFLKQNKYDPDNGCLIIMKKGDGKVFDYKTFVCKVPKHLSAVEFALSRARQDRNVYQKTGKMPNLDRKFIEEINARFFEKTEHKGEPGYGSFRRVYFKDGNWVLPDVYIEGLPLKLIRCEQVPDEMENLLNWYNNCNIHPVLKAIIFKARFIKIHPFCDGNGRTSRIILNNMLVRYGYPTITVSGSDKNIYLQAQDKAMLDNDYTDLIKLILKYLNQRCDKYIDVINEQKAHNEEIERI